MGCELSLFMLLCELRGVGGGSVGGVGVGWWWASGGVVGVRELGHGMVRLWKRGGLGGGWCGAVERACTSSSFQKYF